MILLYMSCNQFYCLFLDGKRGRHDEKNENNGW